MEKRSRFFLCNPHFDSDMRNSMIHQYKLNGYNIVLDVYSGSVHAVDELAYDAIALVDAGHPRAEAADLLAKKKSDHPEVTAEDINDCFDDIEELKADGKL